MIKESFYIYKKRYILSQRLAVYQIDQLVKFLQDRVSFVEVQELKLKDNRLNSAWPKKCSMCFVNKVLLLPFFFLLLYFLSEMYLLSSLISERDDCHVATNAEENSNSRKEGNGGACREGDATWPENSS